MKRITMTMNGENVILLEECKDNWSISANEAETRYCLRGTVVDRLAAYEDIGLTPEGIKRLQEDNARLHKLIDNMEAILQEGETNSNS